MSQHNCQTTILHEAEKLLAVQPVAHNHFIEIKEHPEKWQSFQGNLDEALQRLLSDEPYSLRHRQPPPLWTVAGNKAFQEWCAQNPDHPHANDDQSRARRRAANDILLWAWCMPRAFTPERLQVLYRCLTDCDASVRFDLIRAVGFLAPKSAREALSDFLTLEKESPNCKAMAELLLRRLNPRADG